MVALALVPEAVSAADPTSVSFDRKLTVPEGGTLPPPFTVATNCTGVVKSTLVGEAVRVVVVAVPSVHSAASLETLIEPRPVAWSYPGPALYPTSPFTQFGLPCTQGSLLSPRAIS